MGKTDLDINNDILDYLVEKNRPFSANDVFSNLNQIYSKTSVTKSLEHLAAEGTIKEKSYGKQKVYVADQSTFLEVDPAKVKEMEQTLAETKHKLSAICQDNHNLQLKMKHMKSALTTEEATKKLAILDSDIKEIESKLETLQNKTDLVSSDEMKKVNAVQQSLVKQWRKRKRMTNDMVHTILEGYPKTKKQFIEEIGLETDEEYDVTIPQ